MEIYCLQNNFFRIKKGTTYAVAVVWQDLLALQASLQVLEDKINAKISNGVISTIYRNLAEQNLRLFAGKITLHCLNGIVSSNETLGFHTMHEVWISMNAIILILYVHNQNFI